MHIEASPAGPDPARIKSLDDLARELGLLRSRGARGTRSAKVSLEDLAGRVDEPRSTIHAYLTGKRLAPAQVLDRMVIALGASAAEQREWAEAWYRVSEHRNSSHRLATAVTPARDAVPHQLPLTVDNFTGRGEELAALDGLLARGHTGVIAAVSGTAGVGKTALALHWAQTRSEQFPDGQLYVDLRGFDPDQPMPPSQALARFLRALGVAGTEIPRDAAERAAQYRSLLSGRRMLILLDNARDAEQVRALLPGTPSCSVLVTSRDSLTGLIVRDGAHRVQLDVFALPDAVDLLDALIGSQVAAAPQDAAALAELCARLPLALRIAAELAVSRSAAPLAQLVTELSDPQSRLDLLEAGDDQRTAIRAVFYWSYLRLPAAAAQAFRLFGLHPGTDLQAVGFAALIEASVPEAQRTLGLLSRANLIEQSQPGRQQLHELLRLYANELAVATDAAPARRIALTRLFDYYLHTAAEAMDLLFPIRRHRRPELPSGFGTAASLPDLPAARAWLAAEHANLIAVAVHAGQAGWPQHAIQLAQIASHYLDSGGHHADALVLHRSALAAARLLDDRQAEAICLQNLGVTHTRLEQPEGLDYLRQAFTLYRELGDRVGQGRVLIILETALHAAGPQSIRPTPSAVRAFGARRELEVLNRPAALMKDPGGLSIP